MNIKYSIDMGILTNIKFLKNVIITSGITVIFGMYSIYHLYFYMKHIENKINDLKKKEIDGQQLELKILKINNNINDIKDRIIKLEAKNMLLNSMSFGNLSEIENNKNDNEITVINKIGEYTCINMDDLCEKDSDTESINSVSRSRSSSINWVKKTIFG